MSIENKVPSTIPEGIDLAYVIHKKVIIECTEPKQFGDTHLDLDGGIFEYNSITGMWKYTSDDVIDLVRGTEYKIVFGPYISAGHKEGFFTKLVEEGILDLYQPLVQAQLEEDAKDE